MDVAGAEEGKLVLSSGEDWLCSPIVPLMILHRFLNVEGVQRRLLKEVVVMVELFAYSPNSTSFTPEND